MRSAMRRDQPTDSRRPRVRRARRQDASALERYVGGPEKSRLRALRRRQERLAPDRYVIDEGGRVRGVVAVTYRRSFAEGGLAATLDTLHVFGAPAGVPPEAAAQTIDEYRRLLVDCALERARRRGCLAFDAAPSDVPTQALLETRGFVALERQRRASLGAARRA